MGELTPVTVEVAWFAAGKHERRPADGYETGVPGLVIVPGTGPRDRWQLLHRESGMLMEGGLRSRKRALELAAYLADLTDWTRPVAELAEDDAYQERARAAMAAWREAERA